MPWRFDMFNPMPSNEELIYNIAQAAEMLRQALPTTQEAAEGIASAFSRLPKLEDISWKS